MSSNKTRAGWLCLALCIFCLFLGFVREFWTAKINYNEKIIAAQREKIRYFEFQGTYGGANMVQDSDWIYAIRPISVSRRIDFHFVEALSKDGQQKKRLALPNSTLLFLGEYGDYIFATTVEERKLWRFNKHGNALRLLLSFEHDENLHSLVVDDKQVFFSWTTHVRGKNGDVSSRYEIESIGHNGEDRKSICSMPSPILQMIGYGDDLVFIDTSDHRTLRILPKNGNIPKNGNGKPTILFHIDEILQTVFSISNDLFVVSKDSKLYRLNPKNPKSFSYVQISRAFPREDLFSAYGTNVFYISEEEKCLVKVSIVDSTKECFFKHEKLNSAYSMIADQSYVYLKILGDRDQMGVIGVPYL